MNAFSAGEAWEEVLASLCRLQQVLPDAILVGGTASAIYAGHRLSLDHDHVLTDLRERFDTVLADLEAGRPALILGSLDGIETGVRQLRRAQPLETTTVKARFQKYSVSRHSFASIATLHGITSTLRRWPVP